MAREKNIAIAKDLKEKLFRAKSLVLTDYRGLTHKQMEELRRLVKKAEGEFLVVKNSLLRIASETTDYRLLTTDLVGPTAVLLAYGDELSPVKELFKFIKTAAKLSVKFGFVGEKRYEEAEIAAMAKIPSREALLSGLAYSLNFNIQRLAMVLKEVKDHDR